MHCRKENFWFLKGTSHLDREHWDSDSATQSKTKASSTRQRLHETKKSRSVLHLPHDFDLTRTNNFRGSDKKNSCRAFRSAHTFPSSTRKMKTRVSFFITSARQEETLQCLSFCAHCRRFLFPASCPPRTALTTEKPAQPELAVRTSRTSPSHVS